VGSLVKEVNLKENTDIEVSNLQTGIYFIEISNKIFKKRGSFFKIY
jgi:hypothetical protein